MLSMLQVAFVVSVISVFADQGSNCMEIIGSHDVKPHSRPYMVSIQSNNKHICGGILIQAKWVLTAANCQMLVETKKSSVVLGAHSLQKKDKSEQKISVKRFCPYPEFKNTLDNDIMLLELAQAANIKNKNIKILPLPTSAKDLKSGVKCSIIGWGQTSVRDKKQSDTLKEADVTVIDRKTCNSKKYYNRNPVITDNMICAGDKKGKKDSCLGDGGGPLMCKRKFLSQKVIVGITSSGKGCAIANKPGIYTWITEKYLSWIKKVIGVVNFNETKEQLGTMANVRQATFIVSVIYALAGQGCVCVEIIGGRDVKSGSGSYMASIQSANEHVCGGTLIHAQWVLTSANCAVYFFKGGINRVVLGAHALEKKKGSQEFKVIDPKPHPEYDRNTEQNNLALLRLDRAAKLNKFVKVFSLPKSTKYIKNGTTCTVLGWGQTDVDDNDPSDTLKELSVIVISQHTCNSKNYYNHQPVITDDMICAGDNKGRARTCAGDAGGPLICKNGFLKKKQLSGIAGFEKGCDVVNKPGIYTRLSNNYLKWIKKIIKGQTNNIKIEQN
ncbi:transmembrane protease serine 9-like [Heptranchias perlo]|uniref:transmembrane protease serine 9-like n=1 Tax=Heptranchias perlo TaxID=212740 RepID=UPI00355A3CF6